MARKVSESSPPREVRANPSVFGEDAEDLALKAIGLAATATVNDVLMTPIAGKIAPSAGGTVGKLVDAGTTAVSAWLLGEGVRMVNSNIGRQIKSGGLILAAGKVLASFIPGLSLSGKLALPAGVPVFGMPPAPSAPALPPAQTAMASRYPVNPNYGSVTPQFAVGL